MVHGVQQRNTCNSPPLFPFLQVPLLNKKIREEKRRHGFPVKGGKGRVEGAVNKVAAVNSMCDRSPPPDIDTGTIYGFELRLGLTPRRGEPKRADTHVYK